MAGSWFGFGDDHGTLREGRNRASGSRAFVGARRCLARATEPVAPTPGDEDCQFRNEASINTKPFSDLTERGKLRRLRSLALAALDRYDIDVWRVTLMTHHLNVLYRVVTASGERFALRISNPTWRSYLELQSELQWLVALARDTEIGAHEPHPNRAGALVTTVEVEGVPEPRHCVLFTWIPGVELAERLTDENVEKLGVLSAQLHQHAVTFQADAPCTTRKLDKLFPRDEECVLLAPAFEHLFSPHQRNVLERAMDQAQSELNRLYACPSGLRIVHGDLHHENVKVRHGTLRPIDFEDVIWAYPIQDIALTFYDFRYFTDLVKHDYVTLCAAFQRGYTSRLPWPEEYPGQIDTLHAARRIWVANWILQNEDPAAHAPFIERLTDSFEAFLKRT